ncbi:MAG: DEAD/DEAH box helicase, partial [Vicinamibacteria bacterium]
MNSDVHLVEIHRDGFALIPRDDDPEPGIALIVEPPRGERLAVCTCAAWYKRAKGKRCGHIERLRDLAGALRLSWGNRPFADVLETSFWGQLARIVQNEQPRPCESSPIEAVEGGYRIRGAGGETLAIIEQSDESDEFEGTNDVAKARSGLPQRLADRCDTGGRRNHQRARLLARLRDLQTTDQEAALNKMGSRTQRQSFESSLWHRLAYHCVREHGDAGTFSAAIDLTSGFPWLVYTLEGAPTLRVRLPPAQLEMVLRLLGERSPETAIRPIPLRSLLAVKPETQLDLDVRAGIETLQALGEVRLLASPALRPFRYDRLVFLPTLKLLSEMEVPGNERKFKAPVAMQLARSTLPTITLDPDEAATNAPDILQMFQEYDAIEITEATIEGGAYWLDLNFAIGQGTVSLADLMQAREERRSRFDVPGGWVDLQAPAFADLDRLRAHKDASLREGSRVAVSPLELLRMSAPRGAQVRMGAVTGEAQARVERLLEGRATTPLLPPSGLTSSLRPYQQLGLEWLGFLWEHGLSGLLCDEMGLGKTHQAMAFLVALRDQIGVPGPFLVVCPTSVVSHWRDKLRAHAPGLPVRVHHGQQRGSAAPLKGAITLTSYALLWRDIEQLGDSPWAAVVFDEVQQIKNRGTRAHQAALELKAQMRLGLTGTPIENQLGELKTLFDFILPGYLGTDEAFTRRFGGAPGVPPRRLDELHRLMRPFVMRRLKSAVLQELPELTTDIRSCPLSGEQKALYREALSARAPGLLQKIRAAEEPVPYIHIFALLNLLKRICNHPALALERPADYRTLASGKWDLFCELMDEALESGQKVIVFTQFLGMIAMFEEHLREMAVGFATLTGASRDRGAIIDRFNNDEDCRVFLGSLKAGGTGIDLVGGSVVIHYDRWWNAAREDQATDRAHRIGQTRSVQVFKLVT